MVLQQQKHQYKKNYSKYSEIMENDCIVFKAPVKDCHDAEKVSIQLTGPGCWNGFFEQKVYLKGFVKSMYYKSFSCSIN